ncbi:MAG TPA: CpaF family protein [Aggregatilinea sp.]|jgi:pilus assembly protein CpaF|uniref:CpaF family protein n=1 Tax=Aggregatilinea sp. TaxID=2806333 RepID=UPI002BAB643A|nr:CpaF family protein [Aggregatilinea sp.]HML20049.1 CpaF family protein [Aggregatilinea sp.]
MSLLRRIDRGGQDEEPPQDSKLAQMRRRTAVPPTGGNPAARTDNNTYLDLKSRVQNKLLAELDTSVDPHSPEVRTTIEELFTTILAEESIVLGRAERQRLFEAIVAEILGFGPLEPLLAEDSISEIMVNGPKNVYIEKSGNLTRSNVTFEDDDHVLRVLDRIVAPLGRRIDESSPTVDARLPDGSRVNAVIRPIALCGPTITIRKFSKRPLTVEDLIRFGSMTPEIAEFLRACVIGKLNIVVSGGTGSGKTTLLNVLSSFIPNDERIITIENAAELQLRQEHVVTLESRPPNIEGRGEVSIRDLVVNCLRMRPDRIVVGECRSGEALDMLQAMNTGHEGSLTTLHSNSPRDTLARLEVMCLMAGVDLPVRAIREQVASALNLIVHQERLRDGTRRIVKITDVQGMEGDVVTMSDIFEFEQTGIEAGKVIGRIRPTGLRPKFIDKIEAAGIHLPPAVFGIGMSRY